MTFDHPKIKTLARIYAGWLKVHAIEEESAKAYKATLNLTEEQRYTNPFYRCGLDSVSCKVRDSFIGDIQKVFTDTYPNVPLKDKQFESLISRDKHGRHDGLCINFKAAILKLEAIERKADQLAQAHLEEQVIKLIPSEFSGGTWDWSKRKQVQPESFLHGRTLHLYLYTNRWGRAETIEYFERWLAMLNGAKPSIAGRLGLAEYRYFKNDRLDAKFKDEKEARHVAAALCEAWNKTLPEEGKEA